MQIVDCRDWSERRRGGDQGPGPLRPGSKESRVERRDAGNYPPTLSTSDLYLNSKSETNEISMSFVSRNRMLRVPVKEISSMMPA